MSAPTLETTKLKTKQFRILQTGPEEFAIQRKGTLWGWNHYSFLATGFGDILRLFFKSEKEARDWFEDDQRRRTSYEEKHKFPPKEIEL